jgi:hypothetical protein
VLLGAMEAGRISRCTINHILKKSRALRLKLRSYATIQHEVKQQQKYFKNVSLWRTLMSVTQLHHKKISRMDLMTRKFLCFANFFYLTVFHPDFYLTNRKIRTEICRYDRDKLQVYTVVYIGSDWTTNWKRYPRIRRLIRASQTKRNRPRKLKVRMRPWRRPRPLFVRPHLNRNNAG